MTTLVEALPLTQSRPCTSACLKSHSQFARCSLRTTALALGLDPRLPATLNRLIQRRSEALTERLSLPLATIIHREPDRAFPIEELELELVSQFPHWSDSRVALKRATAELWRLGWIHRVPFEEFSTSSRASHDRWAFMATSPVAI